MMIRFILNETIISTDKAAGMTLLDFIRNDADLKGTKIGCREGDCGACTVLEGRLDNNKMSYKTIVSCLTPLGNIHGCHIVTVEGINLEKLSPVQTALVDSNGTQCGFCTPGIVMALTSFLISNKQFSFDDAISAIDGNICRCTGYKSIERAARQLIKLKNRIERQDSLDWMIENNYLPKYFRKIPEKLLQISPDLLTKKTFDYIIGGGTDLMVQEPDDIQQQKLVLLSGNEDLKGISVKDGYCLIGAATTASEILESTILQEYFPELNNYFKLISSTPIRNMGTIAGNIVNASPIGDLSIFLLALDTDLFLVNGAGKSRKVALRDFFIAYKKLDKTDDEIIEKVGFSLPEKEAFFNFEKVSKRQFLDIASVNSAIQFKISKGKIKDLKLSAGGVSPVPLLLKNTCQFLNGKQLNTQNLIEANEIIQSEISPISDIRGSSDYKRLLLKQLFLAHFIELLPERIDINELLSIPVS